MVFKGKKLQNVPLTRADLRIRKIEEQLGKEIVRSERTREQVLDLQYWWKRFALFLIDREKSKCERGQTRSRHSKATRWWFLLVSRCQRRLYEAVCFEATKSVIRECDQRLLWLQSNHGVWPHRRARNRCLVCVANYISARDRADREKLFCRAKQLWQAERSQAYSLVTHVLHTHGDLGDARFCPGCKKLCASEKGVFMHFAGHCKSLGRT